MPSTGSKWLLVGLVGLTGDITGPWKRPRPNVGTGIRNQLTPRKDGDYHAWGFTKEDRRLQGFIQTIPSRNGLQEDNIKPCYFDLILKAKLKAGQQVADSVMNKI